MNRRKVLPTTTTASAVPVLANAPDVSRHGGVEQGIEIRVARPTDKLAEVLAFYRDGFGLPVIGNFEGHAGYSGVMLGLPDSRCHLEFTHLDKGSPCPAPTKDNLLVLYMPDLQVYAGAVSRLRAQGHDPVEPENPYWKESSLTFEDPDGWRVVLRRGNAFTKDGARF
jgi:catechol 2,3-dioxygenase-like lactoylglutathione lyase family enzyme